MLAAEKGVKGVAVAQDLIERVFDARRRSDALFNLVRGNALYERPIPERHALSFIWDISRHSIGIY